MKKHCRSKFLLQDELQLKLHFFKAYFSQTNAMKKDSKQLNAHLNHFCSLEMKFRRTDLRQTLFPFKFPQIGSTFAKCILNQGSLFPNLQVLFYSEFYAIVALKIFQINFKSSPSLRHIYQQMMNLAFLH